MVHPQATEQEGAPPLAIVVPGVNRVYPSEDPANQTASDAAEAFPLSGREKKDTPALAAQVRQPREPQAIPEEEPFTPETAKLEDERDAAKRVDDRGVPPATRPADALTRSAAPAPASNAPPAGVDPAGAGRDGAGRDGVRPAPVDRDGAELRYRVQLFATGTQKVADDRRATMSEFLRLPLFVESENGLFKVRTAAGSRAEALVWLEQAVGLGYADAFLVPVTPQTVAR
ncbi:MAG: hypothetical protein IPK72_12820 [Candidatus Eisenbacteria bacterium]|nr:hypothetical protein [Candidatus Eisenbacteria bacterium]